MRQALKTEEAINGKFKLARKQDVLPTWHRRGIPEEVDYAGAPNVAHSYYLEPEEQPWQPMLSRSFVVHRAKTERTVSS